MGGRGSQPDSREGQAGSSGVADRLVVPLTPDTPVEILSGVEVIDVNRGLDNGVDLRVHFASCGLAA